MSANLLQELRDEADLCRNEGAEDCADLFDAAANEIEKLREALRLIVWRDLRYVDGYLDGGLIPRADIMKAREMGGFAAPLPPLLDREITTKRSTHGREG